LWRNVTKLQAGMSLEDIAWRKELLRSHIMFAYCLVNHDDFLV
jgi:hypothetical protein